MKKYTMNKEINLLNRTEDYNYFFGFHDISCWNRNEDKMAALRIRDITTPPVSNMSCDVGFINLNRTFIKLGETLAYNYPQGARQQFIGDSNLLIVNDVVDGQWGSKIYDTDRLQLKSSHRFSTHVITKEGEAFGIDYARLFRLGAYGYNGGIKDLYAGFPAPDNTGIFKHNVFTGAGKLMLSIKEVANFCLKESISPNHYITHLLLSPNERRIAFLHRYKLKDGGETTRLMTISVDGEGLRCIATGFLSHFDWKSDHEITIYGRFGTKVEGLRNSLLYKLLPSGPLAVSKKLIKRLIRHNSLARTNMHDALAWHVFTDEDEPRHSFLAKGIITEDGHPMFCPVNRDWMICDTYPDKQGIRTLFLFQHSTQTRINLGTYEMLHMKPDMNKVMNTIELLDKSVLKKSSIEDLIFTRSGLHCDLHPRWMPASKMVNFDSIHEGYRSVYAYDVSQFVTA
ncbi:hypothetical protein ACDQ55_20250 [Chitinophaga sp. 30R24]|uniref:hypothetical protein n=1 Tax=Chitinophaga sp. 30R24 TaxID=3248838 RepID=UPI003B91A302